MADIARKLSIQTPTHGWVLDLASETMARLPVDDDVFSRSTTWITSSMKALCAARGVDPDTAIPSVLLVLSLLFVVRRLCSRAPVLLMELATFAAPDHWHVSREGLIVKATTEFKWDEVRVFCTFFWS